MNGLTRVSKHWKMSALLLALAILGLAFAATPVDMPDRVRIQAAPPGGTWYAWGGALANIIYRDLGVEADVTVTGGAIQTPQFVHQNPNDIGFAPLGTAYQAYHGIGDFDRAHEDVRILFVGYPAAFHIWVRADSDIHDLQDLNGRSIVIGTPGITHNIFSRALFEALDIQPARLHQVTTGDGASMFRDGLADVMILVVGAPNATVLEMEATRDIRLLEFSEEDMVQVSEVAPYFTPLFLESGIYDSAPDGLQTMETWIGTVGNKNLPNEFVYSMLEALWDNLDEMIAAHGAATHISLDIQSHAVFPMHPGAIEFFEERGAELPDAAYE
jgi:uncharacterized protein